jgi:hypothetical protein
VAGRSRPLAPCVFWWLKLDRDLPVAEPRHLRYAPPSERGAFAAYPNQVIRSPLQPRERIPGWLESVRLAKLPEDRRSPLISSADPNQCDPSRRAWHDEVNEQL